jgi:hypothetical protein
MPSSPSSFAIYNNMLSLSLSLSLSLLRALSLSGMLRPMKLTEETLRSDSRIERLMKNPNWKPAAEAAMAFYLYGTDCPITSWQKSSSWAQVKMVCEEQTKK